MTQSLCRNYSLQQFIIIIQEQKDIQVFIEFYSLKLSSNIHQQQNEL